MARTFVSAPRTRKMYFVGACNIQEAAAAAEPSDVRDSESSSGVSAVTAWVTVTLPVSILTPSTLRKKYVFKDPLVTLLTTTSLTLSISPFCPHSVFMLFIWI